MNQSRNDLHLTGALSSVLNRDLPVLNWPAEPKRVPDRKRHLPIGADAGAQDSWNLQCFKQHHVSAYAAGILRDRPVHPPDIEA